eukprot:jgi/Chrzof1/1098/Cz01g40020.t1
MPCSEHDRHNLVSQLVTYFRCSCHRGQPYCFTAGSDNQAARLTIRVRTVHHHSTPAYAPRRLRPQGSSSTL